MRIIRHYILKDFLSAFFFSLAGITFIMVLGNLIRISDLIIRKGIPVLIALKAFLYFIPYLFEFTIPLACLLGALLSMGRVAADNELIPIRNAGISLLRIFDGFLILGLIASLFLIILHNKIMPELHYQSRALLKSVAQKNIYSLIEPGVFIDTFPNYILYVGDIKGNTLKNVIIYEILQDKPSRTTFAQRGEFISEENALRIKLEKGFRDEINPNDPSKFYRLNFQVMFTTIEMPKQMPESVSKKPRDYTLKELKQEIALLETKGISTLPLVIELQRRVSFSFSALIFIILGFSVAISIHQREKSINFTVAFISAGMYYLLYLLGESLALKGSIPPSLGVWLPNVIMGSGGVYVYLKNAYLR